MKNTALFVLVIALVAVGLVSAQSDDSPTVTAAKYYIEVLLEATTARDACLRNVSMQDGGVLHQLYCEMQYNTRMVQLDTEVRLLQAGIIQDTFVDLVNQITGPH